MKQIMRNKKNIQSYVALFVCPIITFYLFDLYTHNPFVHMDFKTQLLNIIFYEISGLLLFGILGYLRLALMLQSGLFMLIGLVNYYVLNFRATPIMPWDILSFSTAASVAGNFDYSLEWKTILVLAGFVVLLIAESRCSLVAPNRKRIRIGMILSSILLLSGYTNIVQNDTFVARFGLYDKLFTPTVMNRRNGNTVAFIMEMEYLNVEKAEGYSKGDTEQFYLGHTPEETALALENPESINRPNIIVIMDEAFSDLSVLGDFETNQDYMPFIHSLQKGNNNTITGNLNVSVLGGNTANTEFEFLMGHSMSFLPQGSVAYQQYLNDEAPSVASYLKNLGYSTIAMHPYYASGWERDIVYPMIGFDEFLSKDDFNGAHKVRNYISDKACFDRIIDLYENKQADQPLFVFNVTMQNHSGYDDEFANFRSDITVEGSNSKALNRYLSLMKKSDSSFKELVNYFEDAEEDTIIVFFGDHQPTSYVSNPILRMNKINPDSLTEEENLLKYKVPYVIWSNFDMKSQKNAETSVNYLAIDMLESAGLPLPSYQNYLKDIREEYPIISGVQIRNSKGQYLSMDDCQEDLNDYRSLQYFLLFDYDKNNRKNIH